MKAMPERSMDEIAADFFIVHPSPTLETIRNEGKKGGRHLPEVVWSTAKLSILLHKNGWEYAAIGRFLHRNHATVMYHCKGRRSNEQNIADQPSGLLNAEGNRGSR